MKKELEYFILLERYIFLSILFIFPLLGQNKALQLVCGSEKTVDAYSFPENVTSNNYIQWITFDPIVNTRRMLVRVADSTIKILTFMNPQLFRNQQWISTPITLYNDQTHGDSIANDNIFTLDGITQVSGLADGWQFSIGLKNGNTVNESINIFTNPYIQMPSNLNYYYSLPRPAVTKISPNLQYTDHVINRSLDSAELKKGFYEIDTMVIGEYARTFPQNVDFIFTGHVHSTFNDINAWAFYFKNAPNYISGIGPSEHFENPPSNFPKGMLGYIPIFLGFSIDPVALQHEILHQWAVKFQNMLGYGGHWNYIDPDTTGFGAGYNVGIITKKSDSLYNLYQNTDVNHYSTFELYLMGLAPFEEVPFPIHQLVNPKWVSYDSTHWNTYKADSIWTISKDTYVAENGIRIPDYLNSQHSFHGVMIVLTERLLTPDELLVWHAVMDNFQDIFSEATKHRGIFSTQISPLNAPNKIQFSKDKINFGTVKVKDSLKSSFTIKNNTLSILTLYPSKINTPDFSIDPSIQSSILPGDQKEYTATFKPKDNGFKSEYVSFITNVGTVGLLLEGETPTPPNLITNINALDYGNISLQDSSILSIKITTSSIDTLYIDSVYTFSTVFVPSVKYFYIVAKDTIHLFISFKPSHFGAFQDTLVLESKFSVIKIKINLRGVSSPPIPGFSTFTLTFPNVKIGFTEKENITIINFSPSALIIDSLWTKTINFITTKYLPKPKISNGDSAMIEIIFKPDTVKSYYDTLFVATNSIDSINKISLYGGGITSVSRFGVTLPIEYSSSQNYPNPFNPSTTLRYGLPSSSHISLKIFNVLGQQVADLVNTEQTAGWYETTWNANVSSGLYFYRINAVSTTDPNKRFTQIKKMLLLK